MRYKYMLVRPEDVRRGEKYLSDEEALNASGALGWRFKTRLVDGTLVFEQEEGEPPWAQLLTQALEDLTQLLRQATSPSPPPKAEKRG